MDIESLRSELKTHGQEQLLDHWDNLNPDKKKALYQDLKSIDYAEVNAFFKVCNESLTNAAEKVDEHLQPIPQDSLGSITRAGDDTLDRYNKNGECTCSSVLLLKRNLVVTNSVISNSLWYSIISLPENPATCGGSGFVPSIQSNLVLPVA